MLSETISALHSISNMPIVAKYITNKKPTRVFVLTDDGDVVGVYERKIDAQNDAIKYEFTNYHIEETEFK